MLRGAVGRQRDDHVALDGGVQREPAGHPLAEHLVEEVRLVGVDEHHLEVRRERGYGAPPALAAGQGLGHDALEGHAVGHGGRGGGPVLAALEALPDLPEVLVLLGRRVADVRAHRPLHVPADEPLAHKVGDGPDGPEPLHPEVVGEPAGLRDRFHVRPDGSLGGAHRNGQVAYGDLERVADEVAELYGAAPRVDVPYLDVLELNPRQLLGGAPEGHQLGGDRALVLGAGEADPGPGHAYAAGEHADEAVGLPVAAGDGGYAVLPALLGPGRVRNLPDDEVLGDGLQVAPGAVRVAEVPAHADLRLGREAFPVQVDHSSMPE